MAPLPAHRPRNLSLGPLETEILQLIWSWGRATAREIHDHILSDPNRELAPASVTTVLKRLTQKGWLRREPGQKDSPGQRKGVFCWYPTLSQHEATLLKAHDQLHSFLSVGNPDIVAAFADSLNSTELDQLEAIAQRVRTLRQNSGNDHAQ